MAKTAQEYEQEFLADIELQTGDNLESWMGTIRATGLGKQNEILKWLKSEHGLNHLQASMLAAIYLNGGKPVYDYEVLFEKLFEGKEQQMPLYRQIESLIEGTVPQARLLPTKTYVSVDGERCFATVKINPKNIRVGLDLGDKPFNDYVQKAKSLGAMPRISHMVEITSAEEVDQRLAAQLTEAYERVHG